MTSEPVRTVFFLSDFGSQDEFAGVVHAVIVARAPGTTVIDLTHHIPAFDVRAGSHTLMRAVPHLGSGVVLGVVDPGVGTARRGICIEVRLPSGGTLYFVGPDNGLLVAAAEAAGEAPVTRVVELARDPAPPDRGATFDGRDLFAPVAAALCTGTPLEQLGELIDGGVAGAARGRRRRAGPVARRAHLPAGGGDLGRPFRQPAAGGDRRRRAGGGTARGGQHRAGGPHRVGSRVPRRAAAVARPRRRAAALRRGLRRAEAGGVRAPGRRQRAPGRRRRRGVGRALAQRRRR